jgi:hypothetical protein
VAVVTGISKVAIAAASSASRGKSTADTECG